jgi:hypothetical protein
MGLGRASSDFYFQDKYLELIGLADYSLIATLPFGGRSNN